MVECRTEDPQKEVGEQRDPNLPVETEREPEPGPGPSPEPAWTPERELEPVLCAP